MLAAVLEIVGDAAQTLDFRQGIGKRLDIRLPATRAISFPAVADGMTQAPSNPRRYNAYEIGWLGLRTKRGVFMSSPEIRQRIHQLAAEDDLELPPIAGCPEC